MQYFPFVQGIQPPTTVFQLYRRRCIHFPLRKEIACNFLDILLNIISISIYFFIEERAPHLRKITGIYIYYTVINPAATQGTVRGRQDRTRNCFVAV
jgi:hypothetical protein